MGEDSAHLDEICTRFFPLVSKHNEIVGTQLLTQFKDGEETDQQIIELENLKDEPKNTDFKFENKWVKMSYYRYNEFNYT